MTVCALRVAEAFPHLLKVLAWLPNPPRQGFLKHFHGLGMLLHFPEVEELRGLVKSQNPVIRHWEKPKSKPVDGDK